MRASVRASVQLPEPVLDVVLATLLAGGHLLVEDHIQALAQPVLAHRIQPVATATAGAPAQVVADAIAGVPAR